MRSILTVPNSILYQTSTKVVNFGDNIQKLIDDMIELLSIDRYGVGLAAPQIGELVRIILVTDIQKDKRIILPLINPEITFQSKEKKVDYEGCLSVPYKVGLIERSTKIKIKAQTRHGEIINFRAANFFAREIQHEVDHLNGVLFTELTESDEIFSYTVDEKGKWIIEEKTSKDIEATR